MNNLASMYKNQGRWKQAEELYKQVMETRKRVLRQGHPYNVNSMENLALTYNNQGRVRESNELLLLAIELTEKSLSHENTDTLTSMERPLTGDDQIEVG
jgi:tetratricopeptide (TPR) repeat protein